MADQPSPRRRFQFRLRTLMIVVTLVALICLATKGCIAYDEWRSTGRLKIENGWVGLLLLLMMIWGIPLAPILIGDFIDWKWPRQPRRRDPPEKIDRK